MQISYFVISHFQRNKSDRADALMLALYAQARPGSAAAAVPFVQQSLARELAALQTVSVTRRRASVRDRDDLTRLKNRLEAAHSGVSHPEVVASLQRRIAALEKEQQVLTKQLQGETQRMHEQQLTLLCSIPGVGVKSACLLLAELGDIKRFSTAAKLVAFVGLTPRRYESGSSVARQSTISRMGSPHLRRLLYMPSLVAVRYNPLLKNFYHHLINRGKAKKAALVACMAKLLRIIYGVLTHQQPFNPDYAPA